MAFPGAGWLAKGGAKLLGLGRYAPAIGKLPYLNATTASTIGHAGQLASKYSPLTGKILGEGAQAAHNASELTGGGAGLLGGLGLSLLGNHFEGADPAYASQE